jgi:hypothetical protein
MTTPDLRLNGPNTDTALATNNLATQLNSTVFRSITTTRQNFSTYEPNNGAPVFSDESVIGIDATVQSSVLTKSEAENAITTYYASGSGLRDVALPEEMQRYASASPYYFSSDLSVTYISGEAARIESVELKPSILVDSGSLGVAANSLNTDAGPINEILSVAYTKVGPTCVETRAVVTTEASTVSLRIQKRAEGSGYVWESAGVVIALPNTFTYLDQVIVFWLDSNTLFVFKRGGSDLIVVSFVDATFNSVVRVETLNAPITGWSRTPLTTGFSRVLCLATKSSGAGLTIYGFDGRLPAQRLHQVSGTPPAFHALITAGDSFQVVYTTSGTTVGIDTVHGGSGVVTTDTITVPDLPFRNANGSFVLESKIYVPFLPTSGLASDTVLLNTTTGSVTTHRSGLGVSGTVRDCLTSAMGALLVTQNHILRWRNIRDEVSAELVVSTSCVEIINGTVVVIKDLGTTIAPLTESSDTNTLYVRFFRNILDYHSPSPAPEFISDQPQSWDIRIVQSGFSYTGLVNLNAPLQIHSFGGLVRRGGNMYAVLIVGLAPSPASHANITPTPYLVPLTSRVPAVNESDKVMWANSVIGLLLNRSSFPTSADPNISYAFRNDTLPLRQTAAWLGASENRRKDVLSMCDGGTYAHRHTSLDLPVALRFSMNSGKSVIERYQTGIETSSLTLNSDLSVDTTSLSGQVANPILSGEQHLGSLAPRKQMLATHSTLFGTLTVYDNFGDNLPWIVE